MVYCIKCGRQIPEDALYCLYCGQRTMKGEEEDVPSPRYVRPPRRWGPMRYKVEDAKHYSGKVSTDKMFFQVSNGKGPVCVSAWDKPEYDIRLSIEARGYTEKEAKENLEDLKIDLDEEVNEGQTSLILKFDYPWIDIRPYSVNMDIKLPKDADVDLDLESSHGGIDLANVHGEKMDVKTSHGRLTLEDISAQSINGKTSHGGIEARIESKDTSLITSHGKISLAKYQGDTLIVKTSHGSILLDDVSAKKLDCKTSHGSVKGIIDSTDAYVSTSHASVNLELPCTVSGKYDLKTNNGTIGLELAKAPKIGYDLDLKTSKGSIKFDLSDLEYVRTRKDSLIAKSQEFDSKEIQIYIEARTSHANIKLDNYQN